MENNYKGIESLWSCLSDESTLMTNLNMKLVKNEWMKIVCHNNRSKLLTAMRDSATSVLRENPKTRSKLFQMKLVDNPKCLFCSEEI